MIEQFKMPGVDMTAIVESRRKDIEALVEANKAAYESMQALARKQTEMLTQTMQGMQEAAKGAGRRHRRSGEADRDGAQGVREDPGRHEGAAPRWLAGRRRWRYITKRGNEHYAGDQEDDAARSRRGREAQDARASRGWHGQRGPTGRIVRSTAALGCGPRRRLA